MKKSFIDSLIRKPVQVAEYLIREAGYECYTIEEGIMAITMVARPNTVVIWQKNGHVVIANAGDPLELEDS